MTAVGDGLRKSERTNAGSSPRSPSRASDGEDGAIPRIAHPALHEQLTRIRRTPSEKKPRVETVICLKVTPDVAQHAAEIWANRRIDQKEGA